MDPKHPTKRRTRVRKPPGKLKKRLGSEPSRVLHLFVYNDCSADVFLGL